MSSFRFVEALSGGTASDTFNVRAFTSGTPTVTGGAGTDTLNYNAESRAVLGDMTPPDGLIDSPGVQSVPFSQIETVNIINPQPPIVGSERRRPRRRVSLQPGERRLLQSGQQRTGGFAGSTAVWDPGWQVYPANLNADGYTDFFLYDPVRGFWIQALNNAGDGTFTYTLGNWDSSWTVVPADLDGDGLTDMFVYNFTNGVWVKCFVDGSGGFKGYAVGHWDPGWTFYTADLNGDGRDDFFLYNRTNGVWVEAFSQAGFGDVRLPGVGAVGSGLAGHRGGSEWRWADGSVPAECGGRARAAR